MILLSFPQTHSNGTLSWQIEIAVGYAARRNRGHYAGRSVHLVRQCRVVARSTPATGNQFKVGDIWASSPDCGVTQGQFAAQAAEHLTAKDITCTRCRKIAIANGWITPEGN